MNEFTVGSKFRPRSRESHICCTDPCGPRFKPLTLESSLQKIRFPTASGFTGFVWEISHFPQIKHSCTSLSEIPTIFIYLRPFGRNLSVQVIIGSIPRGICHSNFCIFFFQIMSCYHLNKASLAEIFGKYCYHLGIGQKKLGFFSFWNSYGGR